MSNPHQGDTRQTEIMVGERQSVTRLAAARVAICSEVCLGCLGVDDHSGRSFCI